LTEGGQHKIVAMRSVLKKNKHRWKGEPAPLNPFCEAISFGWVGLLCGGTPMRTFAMAFILVTTLVLGTDAASAAPWCTEAAKGGGTNCGFYSFQQCMASASGNGGFCRQNQFENPHWTGRTVQRRYRRSD
jgi:hypothetical protein